MWNNSVPKGTGKGGAPTPTRSSMLSDAASRPNTTTTTTTTMNDSSSTKSPRHHHHPQSREMIEYSYRGEDDDEEALLNFVVASRCRDAEDAAAIAAAVEGAEGGRESGHKTSTRNRQDNNNNNNNDDDAIQNPTPSCASFPPPSFPPDFPTFAGPAIIPPPSSYEFDNQGRLSTNGKNNLPPGAPRPGAYSAAPGQTTLYDRVVSFRLSRFGLLRQFSSYQSSNNRSRRSTAQTSQRHQTTTTSNEENDEETNIKRNQQQRKRMLIALVAVVVLVMAIIVIPLVLKKKKGNNNSSKKAASGTVSKEGSSAASTLDGNILTTQQHEYLAALLPTKTREIIENAIIRELEDSQKAPQYQAYVWLSKDPNFVTNSNYYYEDWQVQQKFALATFFYAMGGPKWSTTSTSTKSSTSTNNAKNNQEDWLQYEDTTQNDNNKNNNNNNNTSTATAITAKFNNIECQWKFVGCNEEGRVTILNVTQQRGFKGTLPLVEMDTPLLPRLRQLDFSNNILGQTLQELFLGIGTSSTAEEEEEEATTLLLPSNLEDFFCSNCRLRGSIPNDDSDFRNNRLRTLVLNHNELTGTIPPSLVFGGGHGGRSSLLHLELEDNRLEGELRAPTPTIIPTTPSSSSSSSDDNNGNSNGNNNNPLKVLHLRNNRITKIPTNLYQQLPNLIYLDLGFNSLQQELPTIGWESHTAIQSIVLNHNRLYGSLPTTTTTISTTTTATTTTTTTASTEPSNTTNGITTTDMLVLPPKLELLQLDGNQMVGTIPNAIFVNDNNNNNNSNNNYPYHPLKGLILRDNDLTGTLPSPPSSSSSSLSSSSYSSSSSSPLLMWKQVSKSLQIFDVSFNGLTGTVPQQIGMVSSMMSSLHSLHLENNQLSGILPLRHLVLHLPSLLQLTVQGNKDLIPEDQEAAAEEQETPSSSSAAAPGDAAAAAAAGNNNAAANNNANLCTSTTTTTTTTTKTTPTVLKIMTTDWCNDLESCCASIGF